MGLFTKKEKKIENDNNLKTYTIPFSNSFRGFHHFLVSVHNNKEAEKNNQFFLNVDLSDSEFVFVCMGEKDNRIAKLLIDGLEMGTIFNPEQINDIENGKIEKIHARPKENEDRLTFFVKYKE